MGESTPVVEATETPSVAVTEAANRWRDNFFGRLARAGRNISYATVLFGIPLSGTGIGVALKTGRSDLFLGASVAGLSSVAVPVVLKYASDISEGIARRIAR